MKHKNTRMKEEWNTVVQFFYLFNFHIIQNDWFLPFLNLEILNWTQPKEQRLSIWFYEVIFISKSTSGMPDKNLKKLAKQVF